MATTPVVPITNKQKLLGGQVVFKPEGRAKYVKLGVIPSFEFTPTLTEVESRSAESGSNDLIGTFVTNKDGSIMMTVESWTADLYSLLFMDEVKYLSQTASTDIAILDDPAAGDVIRIPGINAEISSVTDGDEVAPVTLVVEEHYRFHSESGFFEVIALPAGMTGTQLEIEYELPEVTEADKIIDLSIMAKTGTVGELTVIGVAAEDRYGDEVEQTYYRVEIRPSGSIPSINAEALHQAQLTARVYSVPGRGYGHMRSLRAFA